MIRGVGGVGGASPVGSVFLIGVIARVGIRRDLVALLELGRHPVRRLKEGFRREATAREGVARQCGAFPGLHQV